MTLERFKLYPSDRSGAVLYTLRCRDCCRTLGTRLTLPAAQQRQETHACGGRLEEPLTVADVRTGPTAFNQLRRDR